MTFSVTASSELFGKQCYQNCVSASTSSHNDFEHELVLHASVVRLRSETHKCALANSPKFYPIRYENNSVVYHSSTSSLSPDMRTEKAPPINP